MTGTRVGNWYLDAEIGRGPAGTVYAARAFDDPAKRAAVKVLTDPRTRDAAFLHRFAADLLPLHRLAHPNVVRLYDAGVHAGTAWYASEFVDGTDLARRLEGGRLPWRDAFVVAVQAARALKHAHLRGTLHRDLKPAHVLVAADGTVKLSDFGVAKVVPPPPADAGRVIGSAAYLPPEAAAGKPLTRRSDFYSLGGVLYTLVTGRPPFAAATAVELLHKQCYALPERPALLVPDLPAEFDELICGLLSKDPARRPASAAALLADLERVRGRVERKGDRLLIPPDPGSGPPDPAGSDGAAAEGEGDDGPADRPLMRRPWVVGPLFVLAVAALVVPFLWPRPGADELMAAARPLLASDDPADWDRAWDDYLDPLARRFPERHADEVAAAKARIGDRREQRRALTAGAKMAPRTDAERHYVRGLRLAQAGEAEAARQAWRGVVAAFADVPTERRWVDLSRDGLAALDAGPAKAAARPPVDRRPFEAAVAQARALQAAGRSADAAARFAALEELFRDDPEVLAAVRAAR